MTKMNFILGIRYFKIPIKGTIILLILLFLINLNNICCQHLPDSIKGYLLKYNYILGKDYKYKKMTSDKNENYFSLIRIRAIDTTDQGWMYYNYTIDSFANQQSALLLSQEVLESAQMQILYTKSGEELKRSFLKGTRNSFTFCTDNSDDDKLFEFPDSYIDLGYEWSIHKRDDYGDNQFQVTTDKDIDNKLVGVVQINSHECFQIDFRGAVIRKVKNGDYVSTEHGTVSGSFWIDRQSGILIAVRSETAYQDYSARHPGVPTLKGKPTSVSKTTLEYLE